MHTWKPTVSVVMCTFNGALYLKEQMDSILTQTYPLHEFLIFDDGSTDKTIEIVEAYAKKFPVIGFHKNSTRIGFNLNFEQALKAASAEVIAIADQDDYWIAEKLEIMVAAWHKECPIIYSNSWKFEKEYSYFEMRSKLFCFFRGTDAPSLYFQNTISGHAMMIKRDLLPKVLPFDKNVYYDWWMGFVAACNGGVDFVDQPLVHHRMHANNASIFHTETRKQHIIRLREDSKKNIPKFLTAPNLTERDRVIGERFVKSYAKLDSFMGKLGLFFLILRYRNTVFYTKKRAVGFFSHIKHAYRWSFYR